jgi:hypothetical protein
VWGWWGEGSPGLQGQQPTEDFGFVAFFQYRYLTLVEASEAFCSFLGSRQNVSTQDAYVVSDIIVLQQLAEVSPAWVRT